MGAMNKYVIPPFLLAVAAFSGVFLWGNPCSLAAPSGTAAPAGTPIRQPRVRATQLSPATGPRTAVLAPPQSLVVVPRYAPPAQPRTNSASMRNDFTEPLPLADLMTWIGRLSDPKLVPDKLWAIGQIVAAVAPADIPQLLAFVDNNTTGEVRYRLHHGLLLRWTRADPKAAVAWANALRDMDQREEEVTTVVSEWVRADPNGAQAWAQRLWGGRIKEEVWKVSGAARAESDPRAALAWARQLPTGFARENALSGVGRVCAGKDPKAAAEAAKTLPPGLGRDRFIRDVADN